MAKNNNPGRILKGTKTTPTLKSASGVWTLDEALQAHRANAWPQPNLFQPVANSLRFKKNSSATIPYISRTPGRAGNLLKWTVSAWVKLGAIGTAARMELFSAGDTATSTTPANMSLMINWQGYSQDWHIAFLTGGGTYQIQTNLVLRDPAAWYHIVVAYDAAQSTNTNRVQIYINGVLASWSSTNPTGGGAAYTPQNLPLNWNNAGQIQRIGNGYDGGETYFLDGYVAEFYNIDGYALQPGLFGQSDTTGAWVPIPYTGSYGTNGFYLPFTNAVTSQTLGYDASLNGTPTYGADQDPYRASVALHLTGNGPAGGQNNSFADSSVNNYAVTRTSPATQGSFSPFYLDYTVPYNPAIHGGSVSSSYTGYLSVPYQSGWLSGDSTIECWFYTPNQTYVGVWGEGVDLYGINLEWQEGADQKFALFVGTGAGWGTGNKGSAYGLNTWLHLAYVKTGNVHKLYVNGVLDINVTVAYTISGSTFYLGVAQLTTRPLAGAISSFAIYPGVQKYTAAFTPMIKPIGTKTNNLLTWSEYINVSDYWAGGSSGVSTVASSAVAPDGTPNATFIKEDTSSGQRHRIGYNYTFTNGTTYTASVYAKSTTRHLNINCASAFGALVGFDLINGVVGTVTQGTGTITNVGNGWYRCSVTGACTSTHTDQFLIQVQLPSNNADVSYTGDGTSGIYVWGAQLEAASSAGNYVPTPANYSTAPALLLNFANAAIVDSAGANNLTTLNSATITSAAKYGSGALTFNGSSGNYVSTSYNTSLNFGTGDLTVEYWFNTNTASPQFIAFVQCAPAAGRYGVALGVFSATQLWCLFGDGSSWIFENKPTVNLIANVWYHLAVTRNNATVRLFLNGQLVDTVSNTTNLSQAAGISYAGGTPDGYVINGQIDDLRVTKGLARYQSAFTPPARALPEIGGKSFVTQNINAGVVKSFTTTGTTSWTAPSDVTQIELLVVGGGGTGGSNNAGGGGAGGLIYNNAYPVTPGQTYTVTVAAGGVWTQANNAGATGATGGNSVFGNLVAYGGGGGMGGNVGNAGTGSPTIGVNGGSGGGQCRSVGSPGTGVPGQGFAGGANRVSAEGGGGGGAGGTGFAGNGSSYGGKGGTGLQFGISGTPTYYAGGGGGGAEGAGQRNGTGGQGGGGDGGAVGGATVTGSWNSDAGQPGTANTGGGGGGEGQANSSYSPGAGGSGIVIVRYTTNTVGNTSDSTTDTLTDSPTSYGHDMGMGGEVVGNYATFNPLIGANNQAGSGGTFASSVLTYSNGNLSISNSANAGQAPRMQAHSTIGMTTGKWYAEFTNITYRGVGISKGDYVQPAGSGSGIDSQIFYYSDGSTQVSNNANGTITGAGSALSTTDVLGVAFDVDNAVLTWYVNGVSRVVVTGISSSTRPTLPWFFSSSPVGSGSASALTANFGQRPWQYNPPAGFNALTLKNFPRLTISSAAANPNQYFDVVTYSGTGTQTQTISSLNFQPDLILSKIRTGTTQTTGVFDSVRGITGQALDTGATTTEGNWNAASASQYGYVSAFNSNGFTVTGGSVGTTGGYVNYSGRTYVAWCWKANGAAVSNTAGTITSQVSANVTSGFSIVTYTGTGANGATIGHGLTTTAPSFIIIKSRSNGTNNWFVYHSSLYALNTGNFIYLNANALVQTGGIFFYTAPTTSVFYVGGTGNYVNETGLTYVAYCWSAVPGFSAFGSYTANNLADGPFIYTGFKPRWIMVKVTSGATVNSWEIHDTARAPYNTANGANGGAALFIEDNEVESARDGFVFTSNGFKAIATGSRSNNPAGAVFIYAAFAQNPFTNTNGTAS